MLASCTLHSCRQEYSLLSFGKTSLLGFCAMAQLPFFGGKLYTNSIYSQGKSNSLSLVHHGWMVDRCSKSSRSFSPSIRRQHYHFCEPTMLSFPYHCTSKAFASFHFRPVGSPLKCFLLSTPSTGRAIPKKFSSMFACIVLPSPLLIGPWTALHLPFCSARSHEQGVPFFLSSDKHDTHQSEHRWREGWRYMIHSSKSTDEQSVRARGAEQGRRKKNSPAGESRVRSTCRKLYLALATIRILSSYNSFPTAHHQKRVVFSPLISLLRTLACRHRLARQPRLAPVIFQHLARLCHPLVCTLTARPTGLSFI